MCALNASRAIAIVACHPLYSTYCCYSKYTYTAKYMLNLLSCVLKCHHFTMIWQFSDPKTASSAIIRGNNLSRPTGNDFYVFKLMYFLNKTVCSGAEITSSGIANAWAGCMPLHVATTARILPCESDERARGA